MKTEFFQLFPIKHKPIPSRFKASQNCKSSSTSRV